MRTLIEHARSFPRTIADRRDAFAELARGQQPQAMFITCSDSRVIPALITGAQPGEIFELRTAGNIVPRFSPDATCGVAATVEFALTALGIPDIVVCGHSHCGAVQGLISGTEAVRDRMPLVGNWLGQAGHTPASAEDTGEVTRRHLVRQLDHLRTYPLVAEGLAAGRVRVHAWYYTVETGEVLAHDPATGAFRPL